MANENLETLATIVNEAFQESNLVDAAYELGGYGIDANQILETCKKDYNELIFENLKQIIELDAYQEIQKKYNAHHIGFWEFAKAYALKIFNEECVPNTPEERTEFYQELFYSFRPMKNRERVSQTAFLLEDI